MMRILDTAEKLPIANGALHADIPELFNVRGGKGYGYAAETQTLFMDRLRAHQRGGSDGFSLCAGLVLIDTDSIVLSHVVPNYERIDAVPFEDYPYAVVIQGTRSLAGPMLTQDMSGLGFSGISTTITVPNRSHSFAVFVDWEESRLGIAQREAEPSIQWYDVHSA